MGSKHGTSFDFVKDLFDSLDVRRFNYFQLIKLLEKAGVALDYSSANNDVLLQCIPNDDLKFPEVDVEDAIVAAQQVILKLNFFGCYGVDSPLPHYFLNEANFDNEQGARIRDFLDIFNHTFYVLLYKIWKKYRPQFEIELGDERYIAICDAISGGVLSQYQDSSFSSSHFFGNRIHNADGLKKIICSLVSNVKVNVIENIPTWEKIDFTPSLGDKVNHLCLGDNALLGDRVLLSNRKIKIILGPMSFEHASQLFKGMELHTRLKKTITSYLGKLFEFDIELIILSEQQGPLCLGELMMLGKRAWLGQMKANYTLIV